MDRALISQMAVYALQTLGRVRVWPSRPARSTWSCRFFTLTGLFPNPDRSTHRVDPPGRSGFNNYAINYIISSKKPTFDDNIHGKFSPTDQLWCLKSWTRIFIVQIASRLQFTLTQTKTKKKLIFFINRFIIEFSEQYNL
jgi:hypothetical protein